MKKKPNVIDLRDIAVPVDRGALFNDSWLLGMKPKGPFKVTFNPAQPPPDPLTILQMARVGERVSLTYATKYHEVAIEMVITTITPTVRRRKRRRRGRAAKGKK